MAHLRRVLEAAPFHGEGSRKSLGEAAGRGDAHPKERVRRSMREHDLQAPPRAGHAHGPKAHDGTITTEAPDRWGTDMTATVTVAEGAAVVFVAVDHCAPHASGSAAKRGTRFEAREPTARASANVGGIGDAVARGLRLRHDHGSNYLADDFQQEVAFLASNAPRASCGSPKATASRSFIRTLKEFCCGCGQETIEELRLALLEFKRTYNEHWMLEKYDYRSPAQVRRDLLGLERRRRSLPSNHCLRTLGQQVPFGPSPQPLPTALGLGQCGILGFASACRIVVILSCVSVPLAAQDLSGVWSMEVSWPFIGSALPGPPSSVTRSTSVRGCCAES